MFSDSEARKNLFIEHNFKGQCCLWEQLCHRYTQFTILFIIYIHNPFGVHESITLMYIDIMAWFKNTRIPLWCTPHCWGTTLLGNFFIRAIYSFCFSPQEIVKKKIDFKKITDAIMHVSCLELLSKPDSVDWWFWRQHFCCCASINSPVAAAGSFFQPTGST